MLPMWRLNLETELSHLSEIFKAMLKYRIQQNA